MVDDFRVCPVCKKMPPNNKQWKNYEKHIADCAKKFYEKQNDQKHAQQEKSVSNMLGDIFKNIKY
jgi:hypothetical protein